MEPLALLCNLYGEGPRTLRRLQRAGFESLSALLSVEPDVLAERTGWAPDDAARLLQEAHALASRSEAALLEPEEHGPPARSDQAEPFTATPSTSSPQAADPRVRLLQTWRDLDGEAPPAALEEMLIPAPPPGPSLELGSLEEAVLPAAVRARLVDLGIHGMSDLASAPTLELARELGLGYTRLDRLQHLARRKLASASPQERSLPRLPQDPGVGGPFA